MAGALNGMSGKINESAGVSLCQLRSSLISIVLFFFPVPDISPRRDNFKPWGKGVMRLGAEARRDLHIPANLELYYIYFSDSHIFLIVTHIHWLLMVSQHLQYLF